MCFTLCGGSGSSGSNSDILVAVNEEPERTTAGTKQMGLFVVLVTRSAAV